MYKRSENFKFLSHIKEISKKLSIFLNFLIYLWRGHCGYLPRMLKNLHTPLNIANKFSVSCRCVFSLRDYTG